MPAGNDSSGVDDAPLAHLLDDVRTEAARLSGLDTQCRNTVAVLITGGGEGTGGHVPSASSIAVDVPEVSAGRRVPIYVIAIAPPATAVAELQAIATSSGGRYYEITKAQIDLAAANYVAGARDGARHHGGRAARLRAADRLQHRARPRCCRTDRRASSRSPARSSAR